MASELAYTNIDDIPKIHARVVSKFKSGATRPLAWRRQQLIQLGKLLQENEERLAEALRIDLGKPRLEVTVADIGPVVFAISVALEKLDEWAAPEKPTDLPSWRSNWDTTVYKSPKGAVLIITPWNYPYIITLGPLVGVIAAGNTAVLKPSEMIPTVATALSELIPKYLDPEAFVVVNGAVEETTRLLELRWDHIFYTGSNRVGRVIAAAAAKHVTPLTLELGGKCPVIIDPNTNIELAAKRILYGKQANAGQICISPDYVLVPKDKQDELIAAFGRVAKTFWPDSPMKSPDLGSIITPGHRDRLTNLLQSTDGKIVLGGGVEGERRMEITIVKDVSVDDILMRDEVYGPIMSLVPVEDIDEAIQIVNDRPSPLVIYVFTEDEAVKQKFLEATSSGTLCLNDTYQHLAVHEVPFGGTGESGYGAYLGKTSFDTFTHTRGFVNVPFANDPQMALRYPPYTQEALNVLSTFGMHIPLPKA
ncbi:aldehyde dehydrogenase [Auriscalpium vulgare]|uniref:Aldehyde dehydrogenase n=1 Tax=Auriscalpium vulgare TaxID=40419 RepID=A0ACB8RCT3_9AGAM|nr:aldehyde dehydrogenase [Auriscalpium vulgare]